MTPRRIAQIVAGLALFAAGTWLAFHPEVTRDALGRAPKTPSDWINLRATFGGTLAGLGAFLLWWPAPKPWLRTIVGLLLWTMLLIGLARALGFALDGSPDTRQWIWISGEAIIVAVAAVVLRTRYRARS
jgi:hypothetical protein